MRTRKNIYAENIEPIIKSFLTKANNNIVEYFMIKYLNETWDNDNDGNQILEYQHAMNIIEKSINNLNRALNILKEFEHDLTDWKDE